MFSLYLSPCLLFARRSLDSSIVQVTTSRNGVPPVVIGHSRRRAAAPCAFHLVVSCRSGSSILWMIAQNSRSSKALSDYVETGRLDARNRTNPHVRWVPGNPTSYFPCIDRLACRITSRLAACPIQRPALSAMLSAVWCVTCEALPLPSPRSRRKHSCVKVMHGDGSKPATATANY